MITLHVNFCLASAELIDSDFTFSDLPATSLSDPHDLSDLDPTHGEFIQVKKNHASILQIIMITYISTFANHCIFQHL